jgi:hypothetical protein
MHTSAWGMHSFYEETAQRAGILRLGSPKVEMRLQPTLYRRLLDVEWSPRNLIPSSS